MNANTNTRRSPNLVMGGLFILFGFVFLAQNLTGFDLWDWNWWALFILLPAAGFLNNAWRIYQAEGKLTVAVRSPLVGGVTLLLVAGFFLFDLSWGLLWPLFLIVIGVGTLIARR